jgi:hypothetical protein
LLATPRDVARDWTRSADGTVRQPDSPVVLPHLEMLPNNPTVAIVTGPMVDNIEAATDGRRADTVNGDRRDAMGEVHRRAPVRRLAFAKACMVQRLLAQ